jgi:hypothetical protein
MGTHSQVREVALEDLYADVLPYETAEAFRACTRLDILEKEWYLAGGTALALQVGHRQSVDLDFFTVKPDFGTEDMERMLIKAGDWVTTHIARGTLYGLLRGAKVSFIAYPFFRPSRAHVRCGSVRILTPEDIAAMKVIAISQRGKKRDFIDLYWLSAVHGMLISDIMRSAISQYPEKEHSMPHFLKSLVYFDDAEDDPMPKIQFDADWKTIKQYFKQEVPKVAKELLGIEK